MKTLAIELRKGKRTGVIPVLLAVGVLGAAYAFVNFIVRKDTLLNLPLAPMDVLLTQLYGMIMVLNLFGIVVATCMIYNMEFKGSAVSCPNFPMKRLRKYWQIKKSRTGLYMFI